VILPTFSSLHPAARLSSAACLLVLSGYAAQVQAKPEALEITSATTAQLPQGKEADGIIGDFVLRNDRVEAVISANLPLRRANMSTFYGADGITPGCLYDLTLRGAQNDQITVFTPAFQQGAVSWVRIVEPSDSEVAAVECVVTAGSGGGVYRKHVYSLQDGWQGLLVTTTLRNESETAKKVVFEDRWTNFLKTGVAPGGILWADAVDPDDRCGYAVGPLQDPSGALKRASGELAPGESVTYTRFLSVGHSPTEAINVVARKQGLTSTLSGLVLDAMGNPVKNAAVWVRPSFSVELPATTKPRSNQPDFNGRLAGIAYVDATGKFEAVLPPGSYELTASAPGRADIQLPVECRSNSNIAANFNLGPSAGIAFEIQDEQGVFIPCKAQFLALPGTETVNLGPDQRAHGCRDQYHSERGRFEVALPTGRYHVVVTRGIEYSHLAQDVELLPGKPVRIAGTLKRLVDTRGWVSADYHTHSTPSGDNVCGTADRLINLAAEHIEFAPTTEHNRIFNWRPEIERLGLTQFLQTVVGIESTGNKAHFNSFPFEPVPFTQDNGAPVWNADPRLNALTLREWQKVEPDRWIQINHPDLVANFFTPRGTGDKEGGYAGLVKLIDGYETQNYSESRILDGQPFSITRGVSGNETITWNREFLWLQMLNQGRHTNAVAVSDSHTVFGNGVGGWRMYMPSASDEPANIDWRENVRAAKEGRSYLTTGPFLQVTTPEGTGPGGMVHSKGKPVKLQVRVQCTDWIDIDRVQVLVNGRASKELNFTRATHPSFFKDGVVKFEQSIEVPLKAAAHLIVVAYGENFTLQTGYGTSPQASIHPIAYHNPIWVDVDGRGYTHNDDPLDFPATGQKVSLEDAKAFLQSKSKTP